METLLLSLLGLYAVSRYTQAGTVDEVVRDAETLADDLIDPLVREPVARANKRRDRQHLANYPRISVSRPGYHGEIDPRDAPPYYWAASEAHLLPDGSITILDGRTPLHSIYEATQEYYEPRERPTARGDRFRKRATAAAK